MAYKKTIWVNDQTPINADNMNNIENGIAKNEEDIAGLPDILLDKGTASGTDTKQVVYNSVEFKKTVRVNDFENIKDIGGINLDAHIKSLSKPCNHLMSYTGNGMKLYFQAATNDRTAAKTLLEARNVVYRLTLDDIPVNGYVTVNNKVYQALSMVVYADHAVISYVDSTGLVGTVTDGQFGTLEFNDLVC